MNALLQVGAQKDAIIEARRAIDSIILGNASDQVKLAALETLTKITQVHNTTVTGCTFYGTQPNEVGHGVLSSGINIRGER